MNTFEKTSPSPENNFDREKIEEFIESALLVSEKINEGTKGAIFEIDLNNCPDEVITYLLEEQKDPEKNREKLAGKILKISSDLKGENEYNTHQAASRVINENNENNEAAKIPEILIYKIIQIKSQELKNKLKSG